MGVFSQDAAVLLTGSFLLTVELLWPQLLLVSFAFSGSFFAYTMHAPSDAVVRIAFGPEKPN